MSLCSNNDFTHSNKCVQTLETLRIALHWSHYKRAKPALQQTSTAAAVNNHGYAHSSNSSKSQRAVRPLRFAAKWLAVRQRPAGQTLGLKGFPSAVVRRRAYLTCACANTRAVAHGVRHLA